MLPADPKRVSRRRRGLILGGAGVVLLFGPAIALMFIPDDYAPLTVALMVVGIVLLGVGYVVLPRKGMEPKA